MFGAVSWAYSILYGEEKLKEMLDNFANNSPDFLISSILPREGDNYFFPKPYLRAVRKNNSDVDFKKLKKVQYIGFDTLKLVLDGKIQTELELNETLSKKQIKELSLTSRDSIPHASIDRIYSTTEGGGELYFEDVVALKEGFILVAVKNEEIKKNLESTFRFLQDIGIGGNRSIGYGKIIFGKFAPATQIEKYFKNQTDKFITLSPVIPEREIFNFSDSYYDYFTFRGAIDNNYDFKNTDIWKDKVLYLKEGSTLKIKKEKEFYGQFYLAKEISGKNIYQYGLAFPLFIQGGN
jgi:CRISPR-associated protein Csm4